MTRRMTYAETMAWGAGQYVDVTAALRARGLPASFVQTGGMCAALEVALEAGYRLLITDAEDVLSWDREDHAGWWVGLYPPDDSDCDGPSRWDQVDDNDVAALLDLVEKVMTPESSRSRPAEG